MRILILSRYSRMAASSRLRLYQYIPQWEAAGFSCTIHPLMNNRYLEDLYAKKGTDKGNLLRCYWALFRRLWNAGKFDLVLVEKEIFPFLPPIAEWWLNRIGVPYIVDYDDAIFHNYDLHPSKLVRWLFRRKIETVMRRSTVVVCGNPYLAGYAKHAGARRIARIPTVIDTDRYQPSAGREQDRPLVIGWIGTPATVKYMHLIKPVLQDIVSRYRVHIHLVGPKEGIGLGDSEQVLAWSEEKEPELIAGFDIGVMPLEDSPWERGKCGYKLIQYMGCGLPVVGSPVGVNQEIIAEGVNGFKPEDLDGWRNALERLLADAELRKRLGANGRTMSVEKYSLDSGSAVWIDEINLLKSFKRD